MLDLNDVFYFVQVVEKKGITSAARALDVPKSSLSRRMLALESSLGVRLLHRTSRSFTVTEVGQEFYTHAVAMLIEAETAENVVRQRTAEPNGTIHLSCSVAFAQHALADLIPRFLSLYPGVRIRQHATNRYVDPVQEGFDLCLRAHRSPLPDSTLVQRHLVDIPWHLFAGPAYLHEHGTPEEPAHLGPHAGMTLSAHQDVHEWKLRHAQYEDQVCSVPFRPRLQSDDMTTLKAAACAGLGIVALPGYVGCSEVANGLLVRVLPDWVAGIAAMTMLIPSRRGQLPAVRAFVDFLTTYVPAAVG